MIYFITGQNNMTVETAMGYVNDYLNVGDMENISDHSRFDLIEKHYENLYEIAKHINGSYNVSVDKPLTSQGRMRGIKLFIKKIIRKCVKWYARDIVMQQVNFNAEVTRCINQELDIFKRTNEELRLVERENIRLRRELTFLREENRLPDEWYVSFENKFRGETSQITERLKNYINLFEGKKKVIDLGCGRGEFLQLMRENNIPAQGVDTNRSMVDICQNNGLDVSQKDCLEMLESQTEESIGGIFASQLVEHLSLKTLYKLINIAYSKLEKDGILVLESVNPLTLGVFCYGFYIDPTHTKPIHPAMLRFMAEEAGFTVDPVGFLSEFPAEYKFKICEEMNQYETDIAKKLNEQMFGAQDYYLVCRKR